MKQYYEDLWRELPDELNPPELPLRTRFLQRHARPGWRALDLGCGEGLFTALLAQAGTDVVGVDISATALARARSRHPSLDFRLVELDGPLRFDDETFELVWASEVLEHIADTARWLSEVRRVMTPGGTLLLTTPAHGRVRLVLWGIEPFSPPLGDHLHLYSGRSLRALLDQFGFADVDVRAALGRRCSGGCCSHRQSVEPLPPAVNQIARRAD
jgi:SAM-dependent methyltransferase